MGKRFRFIFGDFRTKLITLFVAIGIWYYAHERLETTVVRQAQISLQIPQEHVLLYQNIKSVDLDITGPAPLVRDITDLHLTLQLTEEDLHNGHFRLPVVENFDHFEINLSRRKRVQLIVRPVRDPSRARPVLHAVVSPVVEKRLDVKVRVEGEPDKAYRITKVSADPPTVTARGPSLLLGGLESIETRALRIWNIRSDLSRTMELQDQREIVLGGETLTWDLQTRPDAVEVSVNVAQEEVERTFRGLKMACLLPRDFPFEYEVREDPVDVVVKIHGRQAVLEALTPADLIVYVDLRSLAKETVKPGQPKPYKENLRLVFPRQAEVSTTHVEPETVTIWLKNPAKEVK